MHSRFTFLTADQPNFDNHNSALLGNNATVNDAPLLDAYSQAVIRAAETVSPAVRQHRSSQIRRRPPCWRQRLRFPDYPRRLRRHQQPRRQRRRRNQVTLVGRTPQPRLNLSATIPTATSQSSGFRNRSAVRELRRFAVHPRRPVGDRRRQPAGFSVLGHRRRCQCAGPVAPLALRPADGRHSANRRRAQPRQLRRAARRFAAAA